MGSIIPMGNLSGIHGSPLTYTFWLTLNKLTYKNYLTQIETLILTLE